MAKTSSRKRHEPFVICPVCLGCGYSGGLDECETCQGQGYVPEDKDRLEAWNEFDVGNGQGVEG